MHTRPRTLAAILLSFAAAHATAQLGPTPSEIPDLSPPAPTPRAEEASELSESAQARPAIDELLISRARSRGDAPIAGAQDTGADEPVGTLERDLRASVPVGVSSPAVNPSSPESPVSPGASLPSVRDGWVQTVLALGGVLLLIVGVAQFYKRMARVQGGLAGQLGAGGSAPSGILEVIGRYPIGSGMTLVVLKFDRRVLLVASSAATRGKHARGATMNTLCELTDPEDVASVLLKARSATGETIAKSFERALREAEDLTDESILRHDEPVRMPTRKHAPRSEPSRTITTPEGDRAELWSAGADGRAAANVLRQRLAAMRRGNQQA